MNRMQSVVKRVCLGACFALPVVSVGIAAKYGASLAPKSAHAGSVGELKKKEESVLRPMVREDTSKLLSAVLAAKAAGFGRSPLAFASETVRVIAQPDAPGEVVAPAPVVVVPEFKLTSIMLAGGNPIAMIDGKVRRPGDTISTGWTLQTIDHAAGTVSVEGPMGKSVELKLRGKER